MCLKLFPFLWTLLIRQVVCFVSCRMILTLLLFTLQSKMKNSQYYLSPRQPLYQPPSLYAPPPQSPTYQVNDTGYIRMLNSLARRFMWSVYFTFKSAIFFQVVFSVFLKSQCSFTSDYEYDDDDGLCEILNFYHHNFLLWFCGPICG